MQILGVGKRIDYRLEGLRNTSIGLSQVIQCLLRCSKKQRYRCTHRFVSLLNKYSQVRCVFPIALCLTLVSMKLVPWCLSALLSLSTNCVTYLASVNMYFIIFLFRFPLFPAIYMFHPLLLVSCFLGSERLISWIIHATWGLNYSGPSFRAAGASVLQYTVCVLDRTYWQCFKKTSFYKQWK